MKRCLIGLSILVLLLAAGCQSSSSLEEPPEIAYGETECDNCRMIISEARYAAAYMTADGQARRFDDIGDMLAYHAGHGEAVYLFWVHDFASEVWVKADEAFFVSTDSLTTPMAHGIVAHNSRAVAETMAADRGGVVLTFDELLAQPAANVMSGHMHEHDH
ncbi:MAG: nitrous oxide reductase accessory protein NosL [Chloroflexi bacterium]|nr:nitrous oxide reductase accessory protein NosL [Chloroflexota bacterium]MCI0577834.1 nitrous oxide reductase accessory protein NosL [Chloroflexota bacterium]MCI0646131.1 nitrous oxide reductase accessory protein NosL [Chloroflexota bacterium]MCI0731333.1 nitrous oxide reductase accessory protein NosL [Chloroflexota bacterium]